MRDFNFHKEANTSAANIAGMRPVMEEIPQTALRDEILNDKVQIEDSTLRPFRVEQENDEETTNLPKLISAAVVAVLAVGGGIYAYDISTTNHTPVLVTKPVAMNRAPAMIEAANTPMAPPSAQDNVPVIPDATKPSSRSAGETMPPSSEPVKQARQITPGVGIGPSNDPAIDAPMTFTADNAPAPQQEGTQLAVTQPSTQTALQQPVTAPNISGANLPGTGDQQGSVASNMPQRQLHPAIQP